MNKKPNIWITLESTKKELYKIADENGRVPGYSAMRRKYGKPFRNSIRELGGYKKVVSECGLKIQTGHKASDGHILSSYYEWLFDEYMFLNNITHTIDGLICDESQFRYDFKIENVYVEIWGISKQGSKYYNNYCERRLIKESIYKQNGLKLISFEGKDFKRSSDDLQSFFQKKLLEYGIHSKDEQQNYPIFQTRKIDYWNEETVLNELGQIIEQLGDFPTQTQLQKLKRHDLAFAITKNGGYRKFAQKMGFQPKKKKYSEKSLLYELRNVVTFIGHFPCERELQELDRIDLCSLVKEHGGYGHLREKITGKRSKRPYGYWDDESNIVKELIELTNKLGRFPKYKELGQIAKGIDKSKHGMEYFKKKVVI